MHIVEPEEFGGFLILRYSLGACWQHAAADIVCTPKQGKRAPVGSIDLGVSSRENGLFLRSCLEVHQMGSVRSCVVHGSRARCPSADLLQALLVMSPEFGLRGVLKSEQAKLVWRRSGISLNPMKSCMRRVDFGRVAGIDLLSRGMMVQGTTRFTQIQN